MEPYYRMLRKTLPRLLLLSDTSPEMQIFRNRALNIVPSSSAMPQDIQMRTMMATGGIGQVAQEQPSPEAIPIDASGVIGSETATPQQSVADDVPLTVSEGTFIINAPAAEYAGYEDIKKMLVDAVGVARRLGVPVTTGPENIKDDEAVDLLVSKGEIKVHPTLAKIIGYDRLEKINNRGKKEVARRQQEAAAAEEQQAAPAPQAPQAPMQRGGFVKKKFAEGGDVNSEEGLVERIADFLITPLNEGEEEQLAQIKSEAEARKQGESFGDVEAGFDILNRYKTNRANLYIPEGSDAVEEGYNSTWDPVLQLALSDPRGLSGFVSEKPMGENVYGAYEPKSNDIRMSSQEYGTDKKMSYVDTLTHELMHKGQYESGSAPVDFDNFGDMIKRNRYLHAVISKKLMLDSLYKMQSAKTEEEKSLYKKSFEHNIDMLTGVYMPAIPEFKEKIKDKSILADMYTGDITPAEAATEVYNLLESSPTATAIERDAEARAMYRLSENRKTATQKRAQGFAEGGETGGPSSADVAMGDIEAGFDAVNYSKYDPVVRLALDSASLSSGASLSGFVKRGPDVGMIMGETRAPGYTDIYMSPRADSQYSEVLSHELMHVGNAIADRAEVDKNSHMLHAIIMEKQMQFAANQVPHRISSNSFKRHFENLASGPIFGIFSAINKVPALRDKREELNAAYENGKNQKDIANKVTAILESVPEYKALKTKIDTTAREMLAQRKQRASKEAQGFAEGGETRQEFPDYIKKYFMPEIDYHLGTIRSKTVARNQYGQPTTAYTSGVRRGDKIYEIPTYDRQGGILSRAEVEASLDSYIRIYGDFGIPIDEYNAVMRDKEAYKQELYSTDNRFKVPEDAITQTIVLPEEEQQNSSGFIPKK
jgi:hypothetical protein